METDRTAVGKIGRMPADIRHEVCRRLADNETAHSVIEWLSSVPEAIATLDEHFDGAKVLPQNLSEWKKSSEYARFMKRREAISEAKSRSEFSLKLAEAAGGINSGAVAVLGGKILSMLEDGDPDAAIALVDSVNKLRALEQKDADIALKSRVADQNDRRLALSEKQFQVKACELFVDWYEDKKVREIMDNKESRSVKIDQLRFALYGNKPEGLDFETP